MHLLFFAQRELRIRPTDRSRGINMIAGFKLSHIRAGLLDHTRAVVPRRVRQLWQSRVRSSANVSLHWVDTDRVNSHEHLIGAGPPRRHFFQPKHFRPAKFFHSDCFHAFFFLLFTFLFVALDKSETKPLPRSSPPPLDGQPYIP